MIHKSTAMTTKALLFGVKKTTGFSSQLQRCAF